MAKSNKKVKEFTFERSIPAQFYKRDDVAGGSSVRQFDIRRVSDRGGLGRDVLRMGIVNEDGEYVKFKIKAILIARIIEEPSSLREEDKLKLQNAMRTLEVGDIKEYDGIHSALSQNIKDQIESAENDFISKLKKGDNSALELYKSALPALKGMSEAFLSRWYDYAHQDTLFQGAMLKIASPVIISLRQKDKLKGCTEDTTIRILFEKYPSEQITVTTTSTLRFSKTKKHIPDLEQVADEDLDTEMILVETRAFTMNKQGDIDLVSTNAKATITGSELLRVNYFAALKEDIKKNIQYVSSVERAEDPVIQEQQRCGEIVNDHYQYFSRLYKGKGEDADEIEYKFNALRHEFLNLVEEVNTDTQRPHDIDIKDIIIIASYETRKLGEKLKGHPEVNWNEKSSNNDSPCDIYNKTLTVEQADYEEANRRFLLKLLLPQKIKECDGALKRYDMQLKENETEYLQLELLKQKLNNLDEELSESSAKPTGFRRIDRAILFKERTSLEEKKNKIEMEIENLKEFSDGKEKEDKIKDKESDRSQVESRLSELDSNMAAICTTKARKDMLDEKIKGNRGKYAQLLAAKESTQSKKMQAEQEMELLTLVQAKIDWDKQYKENRANCARAYYEECIKAYAEEVIVPAMSNKNNKEYNINDDPVIKSSKEFLAAAKFAVKQCDVKKEDLTPIFEFQACQLHDCMQKMGCNPPAKPDLLEQSAPTETDCADTIEKLAKSGKRSLAAKAFIAVGVLLGVTAVVVGALALSVLFPPAVLPFMGFMAPVVGPTMLTAATAAIATLGYVASVGIGFKIEEIHQERGTKACAQVKATAARANTEIKAIEERKNSNNLSPEISEPRSSLSPLIRRGLFSMRSGVAPTNIAGDRQPVPIQPKVKGVMTS